MGKLFSTLFGVTPQKQQAKKGVILECRPDVVTWSKFDSNIEAIIQDAEKHGIDTKKGIRLRCQLVPEPNNKADKKAVKIMAKIPVDNLKYRHIGYISSAETTLVRKYFPYVESGEYYWRLYMNISRTMGTVFDLSLEKSKFQ